MFSCFKPSSDCVQMYKNGISNCERHITKQQLYIVFYLSTQTECDLTEPKHVADCGF